jgi:hypothetical protein
LIFFRYFLYVSVKSISLFLWCQKTFLTPILSWWMARSSPYHWHWLTEVWLSRNIFVVDLAFG